VMFQPQWYATCRHDDEVELLLRGVVQRHVGDDPHAVARGDLQLVLGRRDDDVRLGPAQRVDGHDHLHLLVRVGQRDQDLKQTEVV
jgi:hypothetical protein